MTEAICITAAARDLAKRGIAIAAALGSRNTIPSSHSYLHLGPRTQPLASDQCTSLRTKNTSTPRLAVFGVTDPSYIPRYWTTFSSLGCSLDDSVDLFLLVHSTSTNNKGSQEGWSIETPAAIPALSYIPVDFDGSFPGSSFHGAWPSVAYW